MARLDGKRAIVTGGARRIGAATCRALAREGAKVAVCDLADEDGPPEWPGRSSGTAAPPSTATSTSATRPEVERVGSATVAEAFGGALDVVVANAGIAGENVPTDQVRVEDWEKVMAVNVPRRLPVHQARGAAHAPGRRRQHRQPVVDLRAGRCAGHPAVSRLEGRGDADDQDRRPVLCDGEDPG